MRYRPVAHIARPMLRLAGRAVASLKVWHRDLTADPERATYVLFLAGSALLTAVTIAAFLWSTGILEWRGSDGRTSVTLDITCDENAKQADRAACRDGVQITNDIEASLNLRQEYPERPTLGMTFGQKAAGIETTAKSIPTLTNAAQIQIISSREFAASPFGRNNSLGVSLIEGAWYSTRIQPASDVDITFAPATLIRYTGLSEREVAISFYLTQHASVLRGKRLMSLALLPPSGFELVDSTPPAVRESSGDAWTMPLESEDGEYKFRARFRNFNAARVDHILDSSIAAVLGVAVGGVMNACLALVLLRRRSQAPHETH